MDLTFVDEKSIKTLEDYQIYLAASIKSLETLSIFQKYALKIGIMNEEQSHRAAAIYHHLTKLIEYYYIQMESIAEILPEGFDYIATIQKLKEREMTKARSLTKKTKQAKGET